VKINIFGKGFIGGEFVSAFPDAVANDRNDLFPKNNKILYFISTIDNYNVFTNPFLDIDTNLSTLVRVLENCRLTTLGSDFEFNFISSWFVYGKVESPVQEDTPCNPAGFYSITKRCAEQLIISYCETHKIKYRIIRMPNVLGVSDTKVSKKKNAVQYMIKELASGREVKVYKGSPTRDFMDVRDVVSAIGLIVESGEVNSVYNVGGGKGWEIGELIDIAKDALKKPGSVEQMEVPDFHKTVQVEKFYMDNRKLLKLGFVQKHEIPETIKEIARYYES
jgi:nucleoside-diphosphate-sugar epimerase